MTREHQPKSSIGELKPIKVSTLVLCSSSLVDIFIELFEGVVDGGTEGCVPALGRAPLDEDLLSPPVLLARGPGTPSAVFVVDLADHDP